MNICIDCYGLISARNRGIGNFVLSQLKAMIEIDKENQYYFLNFLDRNYHLKDYINADNLHELYYFLIANDNACLSKYPDMVGDLIKKVVDDYNIDVFYVTSPFANHKLYYKKEWFRNAKVIGTMWDMIPFIYKDEYMHSNELSRIFYNKLKSILFFDHFVAISKSAKDDFLSFAQYDENKVSVINGASADFIKKINVSKEDKEKILTKFKITKPFIICTGGDDYRKNIGGLIKGFSKLDKQLIDKYQLVIVCKMRKEAIDNYLSLANSLNIPNSVIFTNFVNDDELLKLYNLATASAFPSLYEGFGMPVVESYACEIPNMTSNNSALKEIANGSSIIVDASNSEDIARGLKEVLDENNRQRLIEAGKEKLKIYNWQNVAKLTLDAINSLKTNKVENNQPIYYKKRCKIAMFTPLPPIQSGISTYSLDLINEMSKYVDIDVFVDDYIVDEKLPNNVRVFSHKKYEKMFKNYDKTVYQMGSSLFHVYMYEHMKKHPDVTILHDGDYRNVVNALINNKNYGEKFYKEVKQAEFGDNYEDIHVDENTTFVNYILKNTSSIITHNDSNRFKAISKWPRRSITIPHYAIRKHIDKDLAREKFGLSKDDFIFMSLGIMYYPKRNIQEIEAFAKFHQNHKNSKYVFVGDNKSIENEVKELINKYSLGDSIIITGYVNDPFEFDYYIAASDMVFNLRHPEKGESSGTLSKSLALSKPVVVNNVGSFKEYPDDVVIKIPSVSELGENEVDTIFDTMEKYYNNPSLLDEYAKKGGLYVEEHLSLQKIVIDYLNFMFDDRTVELNGEILRWITKNIIKEYYYKKQDIIDISKTFGYILSN